MFFTSRSPPDAIQRLSSLPATTTVVYCRPHTDRLQQPRPFRLLPTTTNSHDGHRHSTTDLVRTPQRYLQHLLRPTATPTNNTDHRVVSYLQCTLSFSLCLSLDTCSWCPVLYGLATRTRPRIGQQPRGFD